MSVKMEFLSALIVATIILSSCGKEEMNNLNMPIEDFKKKVGIEVCDNSIIDTSGHSSKGLNFGWDVYLIKFENVDCLERSFDSIKINSKEYRDFDERKYFKSVGFLGKDMKGFVASRVSELEISIAVRKF